MRVLYRWPFIVLSLFFENSTALTAAGAEGVSTAYLVLTCIGGGAIVEQKHVDASRDC